MTFLPVRKHGKSIKFHNYFDITTHTKVLVQVRYFLSFISTEALRAETHHDTSHADFLC